MAPSMVMASAKVSSTVMDTGEDRVEPGAPPQLEGEQRRQDQQGALGDVDDPHHAEHQGQAGGQQRVHPADEQTEDDGLDGVGHRLAPNGQLFQSGLGATACSAVATSLGRTISDLPPCHWASRKSDCGAPVSSQRSGPRIVSTWLAWSHSASLSWSISLTASTAACSTCAAANASAASSSGSLLYFCWYRRTNSWLSG